MNNLNIEATEQTLKIDLDYNKEVLSFEGESYPENTLEFFEPVVNWVTEYFTMKDSAEIVFDIEYLNSSSYKSIYDLIQYFQEMADSGKSIKIKWRYPEDDEDLKETGEDLTDETHLNIDYIGY